MAAENEHPEIPDEMSPEEARRCLISGNARTANMSGPTQSYNAKRAQCAVLPTGDGRDLNNEPIEFTRPCFP